ncbi:hypothetical protein PVK06_024604 [Gossypium arboreum]|uniref:Uncharacterized protein n=1 Tax=Gossypium arboreum TaxID=29729 RepID=A0ABR0PE65_GOSAR|nr:hypothetical protein PVK06_024604 [Gossypium arboreum]
MKEKECEREQKERKKEKSKIEKEKEKEFDQEKKIEKEISEESCDKFQLQYFSDVRHFHLIEKGKVDGGIQPQVLKGKESLAIEPRQTGLKIADKIFDDLVFKRSPIFDMVNCYPLFVVDKLVLSGSMRSCSLDLFCDEKSVEAVRLDRQTPNMILHDNGFSRKAF